MRTTESTPLPRRVLARLRAGSLDQALADGADPASSPQLRIRARALTAPPHRDNLAASIDLLLDGARRHRPLARREAIDANRPLLRSISSALRDGAPPAVRGVAMVSTLLTDGTGPLYAARRAQEASRALEQAYASLGVPRAA